MAAAPLSVLDINLLVYALVLVGLECDPDVMATVKALPMESG